jgi:hypothetical protein
MSKRACLCTLLCNVFAATSACGLCALIVASSILIRVFDCLF